MKKQQNSTVFFLVAATLAISNGMTHALKDPASPAIQRIHRIPCGGSSTVEEATVEAGKELLSKENLGAFFAGM